MTDLVVVPAGSDKLVICHWQGDGGVWEAISVSHSALNGHDNHDFDIWPPVTGVTPGHNWENGSDVYLAGCVLGANPSPTPTGSESGTSEPSPTQTATLPPTGPVEIGAQVAAALALVAAGLWLQRTSERARRRQRGESF